MYSCRGFILVVLSCDFARVLYCSLVTHPTLSRRRFPRLPVPCVTQGFLYCFDDHPDPLSSPPRPPSPVPCTLHPAPCTLHPAPGTLHTSPRTPHPPPCNLRPHAKTQNQESRIIHPANRTLDTENPPRHPVTCNENPTTHQYEPTT